MVLVFGCQGLFIWMPFLGFQTKLWLFVSPLSFFKEKSEKKKALELVPSGVYRELALSTYCIGAFLL